MSPALFRAALRRALAASLALGVGARVVAQVGGSMPDALPPNYERRGPRAMIFFPPVPPPIDRPVAQAAPGAARWGAAPPALANYMCEFFYPQLGTRLANGGKLPDKLQQELDGYMATKAALTRDVRVELERLQGADASTRLAALQTLARRQTLRLAQLQEQAERLRHDLLRSEGDWSELREWHLNDGPRRGFSPYEIAQVMRAYAYYQNALLPAQRRLLLEIAVELSVAAEDANKAASAQPYLFFSPEPARVTIPEDIAPEVATMIAAYQAKKSTLKKQLYDAIYKFDGSGFAFFRSSLRSLADKQAGPLNELEALAEDIRRKMAERPFVRPVEKSPLPADLVGRVSNLLRDREAARRETRTKVEDFLATVDDARVSYKFEDDGLKFAVLPRPGPDSDIPTPAQNQRADFVAHALAGFAESYAQRLAELMTERDAIRQLAGITLGTTKETAIDNALAAAVKFSQLQQSAGAYDEYRTAVFEPGLSIDQRRLLLDESIQRLNLPLPRGELQPGRRGESW